MTQKRFGRCIVIDDDDILLSARLLLRDLFDEVAAFQDPAEALAAMEQVAAFKVRRAFQTSPNAW